MRSNILLKLIFASCVWYSDRAYYGLCVLIKDIGRRLPLQLVARFNTRGEDVPGILSFVLAVLFRIRYIWHVICVRSIPGISKFVLIRRWFFLLVVYGIISWIFKGYFYEAVVQHVTYVSDFCRVCRRVVTTRRNFQFSGTGVVAALQPVK